MSGAITSTPTYAFMACDRNKTKSVFIYFLEKQAHGKSASNIAGICSSLSSALAVSESCVQACGRAQFKPDGTRWHTGGEVKGKQASGVSSQQSCTLPQNMVYPALLPLLPLMRTPRLPVVDWTDPSPADLNGLVRFAERPNLVSARVPSRFKRALIRTRQIDCLNGGWGKIFRLLVLPFVPPNAVARVCCEDSGSDTVQGHSELFKAEDAHNVRGLHNTQQYKHDIKGQNTLRFHKHGCLIRNE